MRTFEMTEEDYAYGTEEGQGFCVGCGSEAYGVEPDARNYTCSECGHNSVFGLEELMLMGLIYFEED